MNSVVLTQISIDDIRHLIREELEAHYSNTKEITDQAPAVNDLLTIRQAAEFLSLSVQTIYGLVSRMEIPCMKRGKRLYFSRIELLNWVRSGRKATNESIRVETDSYLLNKKDKKTKKNNSK